MHTFNVSILHKKTYQIAPSKAVVKVDRPMKAPSMHINTNSQEKKSEKLTSTGIL